MHYLTKEKQPKMPAIVHIFTFEIYYGMAIMWYLSSNSLWRLYPHPVHMAIGIGFAELAVPEPIYIIHSHSVCQAPPPFFF